jgi:hypothetical protein
MSIPMIVNSISANRLGRLLPHEAETGPEAEIPLAVNAPIDGDVRIKPAKARDRAFRHLGVRHKQRWVRFRALNDIELLDKLVAGQHAAVGADHANLAVPQHDQRYLIRHLDGSIASGALA